MDHSKFETLEEGLKGVTLVDKMSIDFKILNQFKIVKLGLPILSYATCIDLEILMKEMTNYEIPSELQWKEIVILGNTKYNFPGSSKWFPTIEKGEKIKWRHNQSQRTKIKDQTAGIFANPKFCELKFSILV